MTSLTPPTKVCEQADTSDDPCADVGPAPSTTIVAIDHVKRTVTYKYAGGMSACAVNAVRHAMLMDLPVLGIQCIDVRRYDGLLDIETVLLNIGLLPIAAPGGGIPVPGTIAVFKVCVVATDTSFRPVSSYDIQHLVTFAPDGTVNEEPARLMHYRSLAEAIAAPHDRGFRIAALGKGQCIDMILYARVCTGHDRTRYVIAPNPVYHQLATAIRPAIATWETKGSMEPQDAIIAAGAALISAVTDLRDQCLLHGAVPRDRAMGE